MWTLTSRRSGAGEGKEEVATWYGDVMSLGAAAAIIGYMVIGHTLRQWMPLFLYALPVTLTAALVLAAAAATVEGMGFYTRSLVMKVSLCSTSSRLSASWNVETVQYTWMYARYPGDKQGVTLDLLKNRSVCTIRWS